MFCPKLPLGDQWLFPEMGVVLGRVKGLAQGRSVLTHLPLMCIETRWSPGLFIKERIYEFCFVKDLQVVHLFSNPDIFYGYFELI